MTSHLIEADERCPTLALAGVHATDPSGAQLRGVQVPFGHATFLELREQLTLALLLAHQGQADLGYKVTFERQVDGSPLAARGAPSPRRRPSTSCRQGTAGWRSAGRPC